MRKRITSLLLTLVMLLSLVPAMGVTASAAEWTTVNSYAELQTAVKAKKEYIKLGQDIDTTNFHSTGSGLEVEDWLTFENQTCTLDLNGKTLTLMTRLLPMGVFLRVYDGSNLTIKDSSSAKTGAITGAFKNYIASDAGCCLFHVHGGSSLTLENGSFTVTAEPHESNADTVRAMDSNITIKEGVTISHPGKFYPEHSYKDLDGNSYALRTDGKCKVIIDGGVFDGHVKLSGYQDTNGSIQINKGTFKKDVQVLYTAEENNSNPAVTVNGGTFEGNVYLQYWPWKTSLYMPYRLNGGTFKGTVDLYADDGIFEKDKPTGNPNIALGLDKCFGYSAVVTPGGTFTGPNAYTGVLEKFTEPHYEYYEMWLKGSASNPVKIIPNAWGMMESVTLDGNKIDYAKDWNGTPVVIKNNEDHTITFKWKDLADELKTKGYRYDAQCMRHTSGDTTGLIPTDQIPTGTEYSFTIRKGAAPNVYSFELRLDLKKDSQPVNTFANEHIVKLMVCEAPAADTRTSIESVTLDVPKLQEGATSGADFTLSGTNTGVNTINTAWENIPESGAVAGNFYVARITLTAEDGYAFNTKTQVNLNGDYSSKGSGIDNGGAGMTIYVSVPVRHEHTFSGEWQNLNNDKEYHFKTCSCGAQTKEPHNLEYNETLDKYQCICGYWINGTKTEIQFVAASPRSPIDGESPSNYTPEQWVHNIGKNYTVVSIDWKDEDGNAVTTFESGKIYKGTVTFKADDGFKFDKDRIQFDRIFNTSTTETVEGYNLDEGATTLIATFKLKDNTVVRPGLNVKVKLPTLNDKIGQSLPEAELVDTTLPDDVELTTSVYENILDDPITGSVAPNKTYFYAVWLKLGNNDSVEAITKKYNVSYTVTDGGDAEYHTDNVAGYGVLARYQTPNAADTSKISSVALTVTAPKYGEAPATTATGANDTLYTVGAPEWSPAATDGKFGAAAYTVSIPVTVKSGYSFDANCIYTVNGYLATYADGKVSYTFPALTGPHTHNTEEQPWVYMDPGTHTKTCTAGDDFKMEAHTFSAWTDNGNGTHSRHCTVCKMTDGSTYTETANHNWQWKVVTAATPNAAGMRHEECADCHAVKAGSETVIPALTSIKVENLTVTKPVKDAAAAIATTTDSSYTVTNTEWMVAGGTPLAIGGTFQPGTVYTVKITLVTAGADVFSAKSAYNTIEGKTATVSPNLTGDNHADSVILTYTFDATEGTYVPTKPAITTVALPDGKVGDAYSQTLAATGTNPITWGIETGTLPDGLTLVGDTIKGTPSKAGDFKFTVKATNGGGSGTKELTIKIADAEAAKYHNVTLTGAGTGATGAGSHAAGTTVNIYAGTKSGYTFNGWTSDDVAVLSASSKNASFVMPDNAVTVKANWVYNGGGSSGGGVTTYPITVKSAKNGDVTASHKSASKGTTVTLTVDPDKGYVLDTLTVLDGKDKEIKLTEKNGKFTFTMPASKVTVEAAFKASAPTGKNPFIDVPAGSYYEDAVIWAVDKGITTGTSATTFNPNGICTRAQAVTFLWRAAGSPAPKTKVMPFADVKAGSYYYDAVLWAVEQGITKGTSDTMFSPDATCTRAQIVTFLWRANGSPAVSGNSAFTDVAADAYYAAAVTWAEKNDITGGIGGGLFGSNNNCTRAQIVTFIYRSVK